MSSSSSRPRDAGARQTGTFHRAIGGNALSGHYTFEWPVSPSFGIVFGSQEHAGRGQPRRARADGPSAADRAAAGLPLAATGARPRTARRASRRRSG